MPVNKDIVFNLTPEYQNADEEDQPYREYDFTMPSSKVPGLNLRGSFGIDPETRNIYAESMFGTPLTRPLGIAGLGLGLAGYGVYKALGYGSDGNDPSKQHVFGEDNGAL